MYRKYLKKTSPIKNYKYKSPIKNNFIIKKIIHYSCIHDENSKNNLLVLNENIQESEKKIKYAIQVVEQ